jgi:mannose-1-phosphate guanylyltransferase
MDVNKKICVIMAGGSGERFWPLSRQLRPKQLLKLSHPERNLLEDTVHRVASLFDAGDIYIATAKHLQKPIQEEGAGVPDGNILAEPCKRNTAGCLAYVAAHLLAQHGEEAKNRSMAVLSADHMILDSEAYCASIEAALHIAEKEGALVTIGVRPTRPETGYGYIEVAENAAPLDPSIQDYPAYDVERFCEKPNAVTATEFLATERFLWNTGMFFWRMDRFLEELESASPDHAEAVQNMAAALAAEDQTAVEARFKQLENISIDFALLEKTNRAAVVPVDYAWDDVGSWDSLDRIREHDEAGNIAIGDPIMVDTKRCIVYNEAGAEEIALATVGVEELAIVVGKDSVLVMHKDRAQDVKKAVEMMRQRGATQL